MIVSLTQNACSQSEFVCKSCGGGRTGGEKTEFQQMELFTDYEAIERERKEEKRIRDRERRLQESMLEIKKKYGKNAILKGLSYQEGATGKERNRQIGGHKA